MIDLPSSMMPGHAVAVLAADLFLEALEDVLESLDLPHGLFEMGFQRRPQLRRLRCLRQSSAALL